MRATIQGSVGAAGRNQIVDVVIAHVMLRLLHRGGSGVGPFYKGGIDGQVGGATTSAIWIFAKQYREQLSIENGKKHPYIKPFLAPGNLLYTELESWGLGPRFFNTVENIKATPILYKNTGAASVGKTKLDKDHLVPNSLSRSVEKLLNSLPFAFVYMDVRLTLEDYFKIKITFPHTNFIDAYSVHLKNTKKIPHHLVAFFKNKLKGTPWKLITGGSTATYIEITTKNRVGLRTAVQRLDQHGGVGRVFSDIRTFDLIIPPKQEVLKMAGKIHAEVCASSGEEGGVPLINRHTAKLAAEIVAKYPGDLDKRIPAHCESCKELGYAQNRIFDEMAELSQLMAYRISSHKTFYDESGIKEYEDADQEQFVSSARALLNFTPIPLDGGDLVKKEFTLSRSYLIDKLGDQAAQAGVKLQIAGKAIKVVESFHVKAAVFRKLAIISNITELFAGVYIGLANDVKQLTGNLLSHGEYYEKNERF